MNFWPCSYMIHYVPATKQHYETQFYIVLWWSQASAHRRSQTEISVRRTEILELMISTALAFFCYRLKSRIREFDLGRTAWVTGRQRMLTLPRNRILLEIAFVGGPCYPHFILYFLFWIMITFNTLLRYLISIIYTSIFYHALLFYFILFYFFHFQLVLAFKVAWKIHAEHRTFVHYSYYYHFESIIN
jgi:hypothetical protein